LFEWKESERKVLEEGTWIVVKTRNELEMHPFSLSHLEIGKFIEMEETNFKQKSLRGI